LPYPTKTVFQLFQKFQLLTAAVNHIRRISENISGLLTNALPLQPK
jgi:hypothetical protein